MKDWKELERMSPDELERASAGIPVPDGLEARLTEWVDSLDKGGRVLGDELRPSPGRSRRWIWPAATGAAAAVAALTVAGLSLRAPSLEDTYDDPALAYAEVERALGLIAAKMQYGSEKFSASQDVMEQRIRSVFDDGQ